MYLSDACTLPVNMAGLPGVSIPCGLSEGLPVGLQFIGAPWSEASLFGLAARLRGDHRRRRLAGLEPTELAAASRSGDADAGRADGRAPGRLTAGRTVPQSGPDGSRASGRRRDDRRRR